MLFNEGTYKYKDEFKISVDWDGNVMLSPNHPSSMRLSDFFNIENWSEEADGVSEVE